MHPIEGPVDIGESGNHTSVLRKNTVPNTLHQPSELSLWMSHEVHIDRRADANSLHLTLTIVGNHPPLASIDEREHRSARSRVGSLGDVHVSHIRVERRDDAASF